MKGFSLISHLSWLSSIYKEHFEVHIADNAEVNSEVCSGKTHSGLIGGQVSGHQAPEKG